MIRLFPVLFILFMTMPLGASEKVSLQLFWLDQFEFAGFYMAKEKGFYKEAGLDVDIKPFNKSEDIPSNVVSGESTYALGYASIMIDRYEGKPIVAIGAMLQSSPLAIAVKKSSGLRTPNDLMHKTVMVTQEHKNDVSILAMLTGNGLKKDDFIFIPHTYNVNDLIRGKTDAMVVYTTNEPYLLLEKGVETNIIDPKEYGFDFYSNILYTSESEISNHPDRVKRFFEASIRGWRYAFDHIDETVDVILNQYNTQKKSRAALKYEAKKLRQLSGYGTETFGKIDLQRLKAIDNVYHLMGIAHGKIDIGAFVWNGISQTPVFKLTPAEKKYLDQKEAIRVCVDPDWMPFETIQKSKHIGMAADYMQQFSQMMDTPIVLVPTDTWEESLHLARERQCDILSMAMETASRKAYMTFSHPYLISPVVFAIRMDQPFIPDFQRVVRQKIGITQSDGLIESLRKEYPDINLIEVNSVHEGLEQVSNGELYAFIDTMAAVTYGISDGFTSQIKIGGSLDIKRDLSVAVRNDDPMLLEIFNKAIEALSPEIRHRIESRWINVKYETGIDYTLLVSMTAIAVTIIIMFALWNRKLHLLNRQIHHLSHIDELSGLYNRRYFNTTFDEFRSEAIRQRLYFYFILLDVDHYKNYNDLYGHIEGDRIISKIGETLSTLFNTHDALAFRLGGEEFGCIGRSETIEEAVQKAEKLRQSIEALKIEHHGNFPYDQITVSGGIVVTSASQSDTLEKLYQRADQALYEAKNSGKNKMVYAQ